MMTPRKTRYHRSQESAKAHVTDGDHWWRWQTNVTNQILFVLETNTRKQLRQIQLVCGEKCCQQKHRAAESIGVQLAADCPAVCTPYQRALSRGRGDSWSESQNTKSLHYIHIICPQNPLLKPMEWSRCCSFRLKKLFELVLNPSSPCCENVS